jgi:hypothetical protein
MVDPATGMPMDQGAAPVDAAGGGEVQQGGAQIGDTGVEPDPRDLKKAEF